MEQAVQYKALAQPLADGLAARTLVHGATKHPSSSQYYLAMPMITSSIVPRGETDARAAVDLLPVQISVLGRQVRILLTDLLG
jgi:hypothetical protein